MRDPRSGRRECRRHRASSGSRTPVGRRASGTTVGSAPGRRKRGSGRTRGARSRCGWVGRGSALARRPDRSAQGTSMTIPLPPPVAGVPFDLETAAGRVAGYRLGEGRTVLLLHSFNAAGSESSSLRWRHGWPSTDESCWSTGSDRHLGSARRALRLGILRRAARAHPVCRDAAGGDLRRCRRALTAGAVCRRRRGASAALRPHRPHQSDRIGRFKGAPAVHRGTSTASCA